MNCNILRKVTLSTRMMSTVSKRLEGKVAIVTASTAGIGYAIAEGLAENGAKVVISSRKEKNVEEALQQLKSKDLEVSGCVCHVAKEGDRTKLLEETLKQYGQLDILVNNAGISPAFGPLLKTTSEQWDKIFSVNVKAGFQFVQEAMPHLQQTNGSVIFNSSMAAYNPIQMIGAYSISKTAILGLVKALASECGPMGIRVNGIAPGVIETQMNEMPLSNDAYREQVLKTIPLNRFGKPSELAGLAVFLSSDEASYITGETIMVTGGVHSRLIEN
uniref:Dehydrogenase/reductase SDR family member 4 n=1 Tax=Clytia hemisphaerica TaxID=252671 RepID=A0A7M5V0U0_9CNID